jgi:hypothetical protein
MEFKLREKHYKNSRFSEKVCLKSKQRKMDIDFNEIQQLTCKYIKENIETTKTLNVNIPRANEVTVIRTQAQLNNFILILSFIEKFGKIDYLSIQTYTIDEKFINSMLILLNEKKIDKLELIISETMSFRMPKIYVKIKEMFANNINCNLAFYWVHSKIILIKCGNEKFNIDGSGNFSSNAQIEHYNIFHSEKMFNFDFDLNQSFYFGAKLRKGHEIFKNFNPCLEEIKL